ncbi:hypothetical protein WMZ97_11690 [Lentibacillus sp. N15]|uniref:hypothetical protein n=1 Tax=Lentibacillus songyuanensis TaxID=3136161 RepID=UPI0031BA1191
MKIKQELNDLRMFEQLESEVCGYIRSFPAMFTKSEGSRLWDETGKEYIDFLVVQAL